MGPWYFFHLIEQYHDLCNVHCASSCAVNGFEVALYCWAWFRIDTFLLIWSTYTSITSTNVLIRTTQDGWPPQTGKVWKKMLLHLTPRCSSLQSFFERVIPRRVSSVVSWPALDAHIWSSSAAALEPAGRRPRWVRAAPPEQQRGSSCTSWGEQHTVHSFHCRGKEGFRSSWRTPVILVWVK